MHLEANLYLPKRHYCYKFTTSITTDTFSSPVLLLPVQRPIHLIRKPSVNPPPFDADVPPPPATIPPPAYEERDSGSRRGSVGYGRGLSDNSSNSRSLSLSPLRIDEPSEIEIPLLLDLMLLLMASTLPLQLVTLLLEIY